MVWRTLNFLTYLRSHNNGSLEQEEATPLEDGCSGWVRREVPLYLKIMTGSDLVASGSSKTMVVYRFSSL